MYKVLVVEDSLTVRKIVNKLIEDNPHFTCDLCEDLAEAKSALESDTEYLAAIVDLNLPDAPNGEHIGANGATPAREPLPPSVGATPGERSLLTPLHPRSDASKSAKSARSKKVD